MSSPTPVTGQPRQLTLRLSLLGLLVNCKPSEPFLSVYLNETKHLSEVELATRVYPYSTLGTFAFQLPFALLAECIGCRPVILLGLMCREATRAMLVFGEGVATMAVMQLLYSAGVCTDALYFAYVYQAAPHDQYKRLTAIILAAYHFGNVLAALLAEALVRLIPTLRADLTPLFYLSWATTTLGLAAVALLPPPLHTPPPSLAYHVLRSGGRRTFRELAALYAPRTSLLWLGWFLLAASGQAIVLNYFQLQILRSAGDEAFAPFGLLEALLEAGLVLGALFALSAAQPAASRPAAFVTLTSTIRGAFLALAALTAQGGGSSVVPATLNVAAAGVFGMQQAVASSHLAGTISRAATTASRFPLLFGVNTLLANGVAAALGAAGAAAGWSANAYYWAASVMLGALVVGVPVAMATTASSARLSVNATAEAVLVEEEEEPDADDWIAPNSPPPRATTS